MKVTVKIHAFSEADIMSDPVAKALSKYYQFAPNGSVYLPQEGVTEYKGVIKDGLEFIQPKNLTDLLNSVAGKETNFGWWVSDEKTEALVCKATVMDMQYLVRLGVNNISVIKKKADKEST